MQLSRRQSDGQPLRVHLEAEARATGQPHPLLAARVPMAGQGLWEVYCDIAASRPVGMGPSVVPSSEYVAWQSITGVRLSPWEVDTLRAMDRAAVAALAEAAPNHTTPHPKGKR